ncbi:RAQPRD family integrative conjugative element protein [bacterium endosymbiont of Bathymodiolus sp. 5 South]|jgi:RAQPRD family integrative conjugative element protein|uniref:RAQPRD family integrative conjugative element protein n=1 Tax=bacterium endosymbiont of Bathymodiolus sp. 5 South TaxID=1181670 RepID=UPI0010B094FE|nr:RAQPRD family integrative conjugative element protein [bacterium endosymbiont of Bathymodiolus sp. 5 South]CAC9649532.1 hypothetical protein [uncultured Gammaproteobacteria bacterium]SSC07141.1 hypothetical protein BTURTLESOX_1078 [bacterium endosymbiont of Bathymodiolus sp. 5 South]VVH57591.1 hypothetical protein BSPCLSOX_2134 [uncultured Gammaproteobacteria bacterium]VVH63351.1 hypothetical protein BSPWISOX_1628 [uncultured Gammaproteobacteria bacterium]VVM25699.1 hypothetical protein BSP
MNHKKLVITALLWLFLVSSPVLASPSNANELLALKKIETYITNATHLIDEAEAMQTDGERYKFHYYALRKDLTDIAESVSRFIDHDKKSHTPRSITPLVKEY